MPTGTLCLDCGAEIPVGTPQGLCTRCLLLFGLPEPDGACGNDLDPLNEIGFPHQRLGDYELLEEIARGGMGVVYRARQVSLNRIVALKMILAGRFASPEQALRFRNEAEDAAHLPHPHIVAIHGSGEHQGQPYFSMDYVPGGNLATLVRRGPLSARRAAELMKTVAEAVQYAHERGVLHRDLKPSNILLDDAGQPRITDFGLSRRLETDSGLTLTGQVLGSPNFMPPEQAGEKLKVGRYSDVYALGGVLFYLLTARPPFLGETVTETLDQVRHVEPVSPRLLNPTVPPELDTICLKCLEKEPAKRYATAQDLADDLGRFLHHEPIRAQPIGAVVRMERWCRRRPAIAGLSAALVVALLAGLVGTSWHLNQAWRSAVENRRQIARLSLLNGVNLLQGGDHFRSLLWFADALNLDADPTPDSGVQPQRIASIIAQNPKLIAVLTHDGQPVSDAAFAPRRDRLATVGRDRRLCLWDVPSAELVFRSEPFEEPPSEVRFAPDGERLLLTSSEFNHARLLSASNGELLASSLPHFTSGANNQPLPPRFDATGERLLTQSAPKTVRVWDSRHGQSLGPPLAQGTALEWMDFSPDGEKVLTRSQDGHVLAWDWRTGSRVDFPLPIRRLREAVTPAGESLATSPPTWNPHSPSEWIPAQIFFGPGELAVIATGPGKWIWNFQRGAPVGIPLAHPLALLGALFTPSEDRVLTFGRDRTARLWNTATGTALLPPLAHLARVEGATFSPDGARLATVSADLQARVWSADTGEPLSPPLDHVIATGPVEFSASGRYFFTVPSAHAVFVWDLFSTNPPPVLLSPVASETEVESGRDGAAWVTRNTSQPIRVRLDLPTAEVSLHPSSLQTIPLQTWFDETGRFIVLQGEQMRAQIWDAATGLPVTPIFSTHYAVDEADYRRIHFPSPSFLPFPPSILAELLSASRLDATGGWKPLELGEIIEQWNRVQAARTAADTPDLASWHRTEARLAEACFDWGAAEFHWTQLHALFPDHESFRRRAEYAHDARGSLVPPRDPEATAAQLDLTQHYTAPLPLILQSRRRGLGFPAGLQVFGGTAEDRERTTDNGRQFTPHAPRIKDQRQLTPSPGPRTPVQFDLRGLVELFGQEAAAQGWVAPKSISGLSVGRAVRRIHLLHRVGWDSDPAGVEIAHFLARYADGQTERLPLRSGIELVSDALPDPPTAATLFWVGTDCHASSHSRAHRVFHFTWENPRPEVVVESLDLHSSEAQGSYQLLALTLE